MYISKRVMFRGLSSSGSTRFGEIFQKDPVATRGTIAVAAMSAALVALPLLVTAL